LHYSARRIPPRRLRWHHHSQELLERRAYHRSRDRGKPAREDLHEQPSPLSRRDVLPVRPASFCQGHGLAGGSQPGLAHALYLLCHGDHRHADPLWPAPDFLPAPEVRAMNKYVTYLPWTVLALAALFLASKVMPASEPRDGFHLSEFGLLPMVD